MHRVIYKASIAKLTLMLMLSIAQVMPVQATQLFKLSVDEWDRPQDTKSVLALKPLPDVVATWESIEDQHIEIRYPGGDAGWLLANSLRDWLVSLGVPLRAIILTSGSADFTELELLVE